jgi:hypothetical protein
MGDTLQRAAIRFVLDGNFPVPIVEIGNNGSVAADGLSGTGGTDENGKLSIFLRGSVQKRTPDL